MAAKAFEPLIRQRGEDDEHKLEGLRKVGWQQ